MTFADCVALLNIATEIPRDMTFCRQSVSDSTELGISDLMADDWVIKIGGRVIDNEEAVIIELCGGCIRDEKLSPKEYKEFADCLRWESLPEGMTSAGAKAVFTQSMRAVPVLMSFYYKDRYNFTMEKS